MTDGALAASGDVASRQGSPADQGPVADLDALQRSERRHRALVEALATDVWRASPDGGLLSDLPRWRRTSRQGVEEVLGAGWLAAIHPDDREHVRRTWQAAVAVGGLYEVEYRIRPVRGPVEDDDVRVLSVRGVPVHDADGRLLEYTGLTVDVTDQRRQQAALEQASRRLAEGAARMVRLQRLTARLSGALDVVEISEAVLAEARDGLGAAGGGVSLLDETGTRLQYQALDGYDPDVKARWTDISLDDVSPGPYVLATGAPLLVDRPDELLRLFPSEDIRRFVAVSLERSWARLPLRTSGAPFGVLALGWRHERTWDEEERAFLSALAALSAQALERARSYERERDNAALLQRSLLPDRLPEVPGVRVAGAYRAGATGMAVGGDWYDAFPLPGGCVGLVVGDVRGKGAPAATVMGRVRAALRAYAALDPDPATVLQHLDGLMATFDDPEEVVTVVYAVLDPATGALRHASAGHLPALVCGADDVRQLEGGRDLPLGVERPARTTASDVLAPGERLLLVTDGLVEDRERSLADGLGVLVEQLLAAPGDTDLVPEHLLRAVGGPVLADDATVLVVDRAGAQVDVREAVLHLPEDLRSAGTARAFVRRQLAEWDAGGLEDAAVLLVSELVTNAVVHARSSARLRLQLRTTSLRVEVTDSAVHLRPRPRDADDEATNGRGLGLVASLAQRWGSRPDADGGKTVFAELSR
jgi:PAS domain S-box-containing protein